MKKILVLTAATGGGHLRAASAIEEYFSAEGYSVSNVDGLRAADKGMSKIVCGSYKFMARRSPALFGTLYNMSDKDNSVSRTLTRINSMYGKKLLPLINKTQPDIIITVHPFITEMVSYLKRKRVIDLPLICVMTDFGPHVAWLGSHVDAFVTATKDMTPAIMRFGVPEEKIYPFGIPVHKAFFEDFDRKQLLIDMGLSPEKKTLLLMAGSFGVENVMQLYKSLENSCENMQMIVITGKNQSLYTAFEGAVAESKIPTKLFYFTQEVEKCMHAADLLITKPGGLTVSEAIACNLPLAVFDAIPGQEEDNANFLKRHAMGVKLGKGERAMEIVAELMNDPERLEDMREACKGFDSEASLPQLQGLVNTLVERYSDEVTA